MICCRVFRSDMGSLTTMAESFLSSNPSFPYFMMAKTTCRSLSILNLSSGFTASVNSPEVLGAASSARMN